MKRQAITFAFPENSKQTVLKHDLMKALYNSAGLMDNCGGTQIFRIQARNDSGSFATIIMYRSGNLLVVGHGNLFDLTLAVCNCYYRGISSTQPISRQRAATPESVRVQRQTSRRKTDRPQGRRS
jgi:hypothetical protein